MNDRRLTTGHDLLNFHTNGDVYENDVLLGRIDDDGDWRSEEECEWPEDGIRADLREQMRNPEIDFVWTDEQIAFAGLYE